MTMIIILKEILPILIITQVMAIVDLITEIIILIKAMMTILVVSQILLIMLKTAHAKILLNNKLQLHNKILLIILQLILLKIALAKILL